MSSATSWHAQSRDQVLGDLGARGDRGLGESEAVERLAREGPNVIPEPPPPSLIRLIYEQVADVTVVALLVAAFVALGLALWEGTGSPLEKYGDTGAILGIVILNAIMGILQQKRADRALSALKELAAATATIVRDGEFRRVPAADLVRGDVIVFEAGDKIPADARLLSGADLQIGEAALTGESLPVEKRADDALDPGTPLAERTNMVYSGTSVVGGKGRAVVTATGPETEVGRIAAMVERAEPPPTPLQRNLKRFGYVVVVGSVLAAGLVFAVGMIQGDDSLRRLFLIAVSLAVAAIPEGLPAITTIVLALGTSAMAKRGAIVRRMHAVETLGATRVLCTDKTGTITRNEMTVVRAAAASGDVWRSGDTPGEPIRVVARVAAAARGRDPTDLALLRFGQELSPGEVVADPVGEVPFSSERRISTTVFRDGEGGSSLWVTVRGAYERVLEQCTRVWANEGEGTPLGEEERTAIAAIATEWASEGIRVIAVAQRVLPEDADEHWEEELIYCGLAGIADPIREEARAAVERSQAAGIQVVMITGDHPVTARAIATEAGILSGDTEVLSGSELNELDDGALTQLLPRISVVARATAADKMRIIFGLRARGDVSAMTGDGVNDAPALRAADIGVAMGRGGTEVAREASDLVLADDNFATIVAAIAEGRAIFANIRRFIVFLFAANAGLVLAVLVASMLGWAQPMEPTQILWINLVTNGLPALALGLEPNLEDRMKEPPRDTKASLLGWGDAAKIITIGAVMAAAGLWVFLAASDGNPYVPSTAGKTAAFSVFALAPLFYAFSARSDHVSIFRLGFGTNRILLIAVAVGLGLQALAVFVPGPPRAIFKTGPVPVEIWGLTAFAVILPAIAMELWKVVANRRSRSRGEERFRSPSSPGNM